MEADEYSDEDNCFFGTITGIGDVVSFEGSSPVELKEAFIEAVEDYLDLCKRQGKEPQKVYKGSFNMRIDPNFINAQCLRPCRTIFR